MSRRRQRNKSKNGSAGTSLEQLEQNFVLGCGTSSEQRLLSAIQLSLESPPLTDFATLRRFGIVDNLTSVCACSAAMHPFLVYAKYIAVRGLTKVLVFKTEERIDEFTNESSSNTTMLMIQANRTTIYYVLTALKTVLLQVDPQADPHKMISQSITASLELLLRALPRFQNIILTITIPDDPTLLMNFVNHSQTKVIVALSQLITTIGNKRISRILHDLYSEGMGIALVDLLSTNGTWTTVFQKAQVFLLECICNEEECMKHRDVAIGIERTFYKAWDYARKESKKGQAILRERFAQATIEYKEKEEIMIEQTKIWQISYDLMKQTENALRLISISLNSILEVVGFLGYYIEEVKKQALDNGIIDTLLYLIGQEDDGTNEIHTQVKISASKCLGNCCHQYVKSQQLVALVNGHYDLMKLFNLNGIGGTHVTKESSATALAQCCGSLLTSIQNMLDDNAVYHLMTYVESCLASTLDSQSSASAAAAAAIAHLTSNCAGLEILGGKKVLPILLSVMANGTESSSHAARIIGNAFSGAKPKAFRALVEVGGLEKITKFLLFITEVTLKRINTKEQLQILSEVLRAAEMCVGGVTTSQNQVIQDGILNPLLQLGIWLMEPNEAGSDGHGKVQASCLSCLFAVVVNNKNGTNKLLKEKVITSLLDALIDSRHPEARTAYCRLFSILTIDTLSQNLLLECNVFNTVCNIVKTATTDGLIQCPISLRAASVWFLRACMHNNARILKDAREYGLFQGMIELANVALEDIEICIEVSLLLRSAARLSENRELIRQLGGLSFLTTALAKIHILKPSLLLGEARDTANAKNAASSSSSSSSPPSMERSNNKIIELEHRLLNAASRAIVALCYCDARTIDAVARDEHAVVAIIAMLSSRGDDRDTLHLCATIIPMLCCVPSPTLNIHLLITKHGILWLCYRLGELCQDSDGGRARSRGRTPSAGLNAIPPKGLDLMHYKIVQKLIVSIGTVCIRNREAQKEARKGQVFSHITKILIYLKCEAIHRKDARWESVLIACCDALGNMCKGCRENQKEMLRVGGNKQIFHLIGDSDLRATRLRGAGRDCVEAIAHGWGNAEDAMNIMIL